MSSLAVGAVAGAFAARSLSFTADADGRGRGRSSAPGNGKNVGVLAVEVYTPSTYVSQSRLEEHAGASKGRYTIGLGQDGLAVCGDCEDVNSLALTVVHSLLEKYEVDPSEVGRLEVGTETLVDKSKSAKTVLMDLFGSNTDIEGATIVNACYGGTAALLNAFAWVESDGWDGRYAIVVAADIATYARGPARPTCGAGAVAVLVGRDAPLAMVDPRERATHAANVWDFFKPDHTVEYPTVDGALSQLCYYRALEDCYGRFADRLDALAGDGGGASGSGGGGNKAEKRLPFDAESADYFVFHAPYNKLVQKSYGRLYLLDARRRHQRRLARMEGEEKKEGGSDDDGNGGAQSDDPLREWLERPIEDTYSDRALESVLKKISSASFERRLADANAASKAVGNTYTASVFLGLASLLDRAGSRGELTPGKSLVVFSYGSGALATMYRLRVREPSGTERRQPRGRFTVERMVRALSLMERLESREEVHPSELDHALETRARMHRAGAPYSPVYPTRGRMFPGTYYLNGVDSKWVRTYSRVPPTCERDAKLQGTSLAPPLVLRLAQRDAVSCPVTGKLEVLAASNAGDADRRTEAKRRVACVVTGVSAGLPTRASGGGPVFRPDNMERLVRGENCVGPVSGTTKAALLDKNVVQLVKMPDGKRKKVRVESEAGVIQLAAQLGTVDLTAMYGVPPGLAETMDVAAQVAVAAGMEALKSAGLVPGGSNDPAQWKLPDAYRDSTGVVYASSFPAMDAAVGEVMRFLQSKTVGAADTMRLVSALRGRMVRASPDRVLSDDDEAAFARLLSRAREIEGYDSDGTESQKEYEFDRKFLFRVLVLGNSQLAQLAGIRGPNTQTNAACAGTTQAIAMAQDMLISGRAERVVVVAGDNASGDTLLPWLGSGFSALGAATTSSVVSEAACPFDKRRSGMLLGAGAIGMVLETEASSQDRLRFGPSPHPFEVRARLLATQYSNSAYHGAALDRHHIGSELSRFLGDVELIHGICKAEIAAHGVYFSHETCTHASDESSCAGNEIAALRMAFGNDHLSKLLILNTKGYTGHPMGVSFEDVTAVEVLMRQMVPPLPNYKEKDNYLGDLNLSRGGRYACRYALRFAAGFGSQVVFALYATSQYE